MTQPSGGAAPTCNTCGAPDNGELVICRFCKTAVSAEAHRTAIPCPQCRRLCRWGKQKCGSCQAWLVVSCVFCGALSPHDVSSCLRCNEPFAGAAQRKQQMEMQRHQHVAHQQQMQHAQVWGNVAAAFAGAAIGSAVTHSWSYESHESFSFTDVTDSFDSGGSTFDFGDFGGD